MQEKNNIYKKFQSFDNFKILITLILTILKKKFLALIKN